MVARVAKKLSKWTGDEGHELIRGLVVFRSPDRKRLAFLRLGDVDIRDIPNDFKEERRALFYAAITPTQDIRAYGLRFLDISSGDDCTFTLYEHSPRIEIRCEDGVRVFIANNGPKSIPTGFSLPVKEVRELLRLSGSYEIGAFDGYVFSVSPRVVVLRRIPTWAEKSGEEARNLLSDFGITDLEVSWPSEITGKTRDGKKFSYYLDRSFLISVIEVGGERVGEKRWDSELAAIHPAEVARFIASSLEVR